MGDARDARGRTPSFTVADMREWLQNWVVQATGLTPAEVAPERPMEEFGLSSRDIVVMSGELENLIGSRLDATVAYEYPTIEKLAVRLVEGDRENPDEAAYAAYVDGIEADWSRRVRDDHLTDMDIAVVGMAARYPGAADADAMWDLLVSGRDGIGEPPAGRWEEYDSDPVVSAQLKELNLTGGYLEDIAGFDAEFFGLSPLEAQNMDPQQRIMLELTWEALEHARIPASELRGEAVGVYVGSTNNDYAMLVSSDPQAFHPYALTGGSSAIIANRVSYAFDFRGPSIQSDTACSASLVAIHQAVRGLRDGDSDLAIAGGVNLLASPHASMAFGKLGVFSKTGRIHAFSDDASGMVRADGAGVVVLKRLEDAERDGDNVLAVVKGSAVNSDGRSNGLTAPNPDAQVDVLRRAYADAGIDPRQVDYIEAHGTGTILGDPIEATALGTVLGRGRPIDQPTLLGSAKTNFGHTEAAAGVAGVIKVVQAMTHDVLPPSLHYAGPNPYIDFDEGRLEVVEDPREWPEYSGHKIAGVSGFGFGGTNAHVVLSSPPPVPAETTAAREDAVPAIDSEAAATAGEDGAPMPSLLPVSGLLPSRRRSAAADLADWLEANPKAPLSDVARTLSSRSRGRSRAVVTASDVDAAVAGLRKVAEGGSSPAVQSADSPQAQGPVWVFSGYGSQHRKMGKDLYALSPVFRESLERQDQVVKEELGYSVVELMLDDSRDFDLETAQVGISAIQIAQADLMTALGAKPAAVVGMSMGEIAAAYAAGGLSAREAMQVACARSHLMGEGEAMIGDDPERAGGMAMVELSVKELDDLLTEHPEFSGVEPAVYAAPTMTTVGGPLKAVGEIVEFIAAQGKVARQLQVKGAGHTSMLDPILGELWSACSDIEPRPLSVPLFSSVDQGTTYQPGETPHDADYFVRCTRGSVWFADAIERSVAGGYSTFIEFAPNPVALMPIMATAFAAGLPDCQLAHMAKRKEAAGESLAAVLSNLYAHGHDVDLGALVGDGSFAALPGMRWRRQRYWTTARPASGGRAALPGTRTVLPDGRIAFTTSADEVPSTHSLIDAALAQVLPDATVLAVEEPGVLPAKGELTTVVTRHPGGAVVSVHSVDGDPSAPVTTLVAEAAATTVSANVPGQQAPATEAKRAATPSTPAIPTIDQAIDYDSAGWDPDSGVTVSDHLRTIVGEAMGYDIDDLPLELPLIDLGLDSLMGMRIKNRVEHDFGIPPLQVQTLRDAAVKDVIITVEELVEAKLAGEADASATAPEESGVDGGDVEEGDVGKQSSSTGIDVPPRDDTERIAFGSWAVATGKSAGGVFNELPELDEATAKKLTERLSDRVEAEFEVSQVTNCTTIEELANVIRPFIEGEVENNIRVLRERPEGSTRPAVFLFHAAGGSTVVYKPLVRRLPADVPVYGVERVEGELSDRVAEYLPAIQETAGDHGIVLGGWSFGGILAYEAAHQLKADGVDPELIVLLDVVQAANPAPNTREEMHARWDRWAAFAGKTYGLDFEVPHEVLDRDGEKGMMDLLSQVLDMMDSSEHGLSGGALEHQKSSFEDNQILAQADFANWADVSAPVVLFRAERMHDGAIELEPSYADIDEDGGWSAIVDDLEIYHLRGDHLAVVDEPEISKVGARLTQLLDDLDADH